VYWADNGELVAITTESSFFILKYNKEPVNAFFATGAEPEAEGIEESFELLHEISERYHIEFLILRFYKGFVLQCGLGTASFIPMRTIA
jgi:hypothetical protein